jgi:hypothetical protein
MSGVQTFTACVNVSWTCRRGYDHDCDVDVTYIYDGVDDLTIVSAYAIGEMRGIGEYEFDELVDEAVFERAADDYADWLADQIDHAQED